MDGGRVLSPSELSAELRMPLSNINYHVTELAKSNLIELAHKQQVRGATEHFYRPVEATAPHSSKGNGSGGVRTARRGPREHRKRVAAATR